MKCQSCGKSQAVVKYYENINGNKHELHFCLECAKNIGFSSFSDMFSPIFVTIDDYNLKDNIKCKVCGYRLEDYSRTGAFGCPNCYDTFNNEIDTLLYKIHGKKRHIKDEVKFKIKSNENTITEKINEKQNKKEKIYSLKEKIKKLVEEERYEEAATIRDEIKKLGEE